VATGSPITETDPSDEVLLAQICKGSRESLGILFGRYARLVRGVAFRILRDRCEADDLPTIAPSTGAVTSSRVISTRKSISTEQRRYPIHVRKV